MPSKPKRLKTRPTTPKSLKPRRCRHPRGSNITASRRTAVYASPENWRARQDSNSKALPEPPVPNPEKVQYFLPAFEISWPLTWDSITNGERRTSGGGWTPDFAIKGCSVGDPVRRFESRRCQKPGVKRNFWPEQAPGYAQ
jgi:hypothetical protein